VGCLFYHLGVFQVLLTVFLIDIFDPAVPAGIKNFQDFICQLESHQAKRRLPGISIRAQGKSPGRSSPPSSFCPWVVYFII
jgi:hypothetical protein